MTPDDPRHGSYAGWQAHFKEGSLQRCDPCRRAGHLYMKRQRYRMHKHGPERVDLGEQAWRVIDSMGRRELARLTGLNDSYLSRTHAKGPSARVYRRTQAKILAVQPPPTTIGLQRRMQALNALGYSGARLAREAGVSSEMMCALIRRPQPNLFHRATVARSIVATYERLSLLPMPHGHVADLVRARAASHGYAPPLAWDDVDDSTEEPRGIREPGDDEPDAEDWVDRIVAGERPEPRLIKGPMRVQIVAMWPSTGLSINELERRTGWNPRRYMKKDEAA